MIEIKKITKSFGNNQILRDISFTVPKGCVTALVGPNGAGKSTTIRILTGFNEADSGVVKVDGQSMSVNATAAKNLIGYAPENAPSYRELTVFEYLTFVAKIRGIKKKALNDEIERVLSAFSLDKVAKQAIATLSKGYRHRVSLAQCLLGDPPAIILDEPTDGLDPLQKIETRKIILELAKTKAVLLTTHLLEEVDMLCERVVVINKGQVEFTGTIDQIRQRISASNNSITIRMAAQNNTWPNLVVEGLSNESITHRDGFLVANYTYTYIKERDILNEISLILTEQGFRIIEITQEAPKLTNILNVNYRHNFF